MAWHGKALTDNSHLLPTLENPRERWHRTLSPFIFHRFQTLPTSLKCQNTQFLDFEHGSSLSRRPKRGIHFSTECPLVSFLTSPPTFIYKGSYAPKPKLPTQAQRAPAQSQYLAPYGPAVPSGSEMPDEWGYPAPSAAQVSSVLSFLFT
jgi:hypothetical protein